MSMDCSWEMISEIDFEGGPQPKDGFDIEMIYSPNHECRDRIRLNLEDAKVEITPLEDRCCDPDGYLKNRHTSTAPGEFSKLSPEYCRNIRVLLLSWSIVLDDLDSNEETANYFEELYGIPDHLYGDSNFSHIAHSDSPARPLDSRPLIKYCNGTGTKDIILEPCLNRTSYPPVDSKNSTSNSTNMRNLDPCRSSPSCISNFLKPVNEPSSRENARPELEPESRTYDIWSFGCVFLDTIAWLTCDGCTCLNRHNLAVFNRERHSVEESTEPGSSPFYEEQSMFHGVFANVRNAYLPSWNPRLDDFFCTIQMLQGNNRPGFSSLYHGSREDTSLQPGSKDTILQGTCQWIFSNAEFVRWRDQTNGIFWLSGRPGTGKSMLTSTVIGKLQDDRRSGDLIVSYCADPSYKGSSPVLTIIRKILVEMLLRKPRELLRNNIRYLLSDLVHSGKPVSVTRMKVLMSLIRHSIRTDETIYILLDGLDEIGDSTLDRDLIKEFIGNASHPDAKHRIKCFVATRPAFLRDHIIGSAVQSANCLDLDTQSLNKEDLALYVRSSLLWSRLQCDPLEYEQLEYKLTTEAGGSFLWVKLVVDSIRQSSGPTRVLKSIRDFISSAMPIDLEKLYSALIDQITGPDRTAAFSLLKWVIHAARPLHVEELRDALRLQIGIDVHPAKLSGISSGLVTSGAGQIVRLAHSTVRGFLQGQVKKDIEGTFLQAHESMAETCLKSLVPGRLLISLGLNYGLTGLTPVNHGQSLPDYAQDHWMFHYGLAEFQSSYLAGLLHELLHKSLNQWKLERSQLDIFGTNEKNGDITPNMIQLCTLDILSTVLIVAARFGFQKLAKLELDMGANINYGLGAERLTPLMWASRSGNLAIVDLLIQYDADIHLQSSSGNTSLMYAISKGHKEVAERLLARGGQPKLPSEDESSPEPLQELSITATALDICTICNAVGTGFEITSLGTGEEEDLLSPIRIPAEFICQADLSTLSSSKTRDSTPKSLSNHQRTKIKWFAGLKMRKALKMAARRGVEDIRKLLTLAGNDIDLLERSLSMSKLVSKLRIA